MPIKRPYYGIHQIITGQYTAGGEFVLDDGNDYIGVYHILPNGQRFTHPRPKPSSKELHEKRTDMAEDVIFYNRLTRREISRHTYPIQYQPIPTNDDYEFGQIERYFVQKRNDPRNTILEIDGQQFNQINVNNSPGINGVIWNSVIIPWRISVISREHAADLNRTALIDAEHNFVGIGAYITNVLEFYK